MYLHLDTAVGEANALIGDVVLGEKKELSKMSGDVDLTDNIATEEVKEDKKMSGDGNLVRVVETEEEKRREEKRREEKKMITI